MFTVSKTCLSSAAPREGEKPSPRALDCSSANKPHPSSALKMKSQRGKPAALPGVTAPAYSRTTDPREHLTESVAPASMRAEPGGRGPSAPDRAPAAAGGSSVPPGTAG